MTDPNPIETWLVELEGRPRDLANWQQLFYDRKVASVEPSPRRDREQAYFVHSQRLDGVPDTAAHATAKRLVAQMNGAAKLCGVTAPVTVRADDRAGQLVRMEWLWFVRAGGKPEPVKEVLRDQSLAIELLAAIGSPTTEARQPAERRALKAMTAARDYDQVATSLEYFGQPTNWYDLWTAYEIIEDDLWNSTPSKMRPKPTKKLRAKRVLLMSRRWVSEDDFRKFAESCNYHRHGRRRPPTPEQSTNIDDARQTLARILQSWLEEKPSLSGVA